VRTETSVARCAKTITPRAADKLYDKFIERDDGERPRTGEKLVVLCRKAWRVVRRLFPETDIAATVPIRVGSITDVNRVGKWPCMGRRPPTSRLIGAENFHRH